jgi:hypothetical protein
MMMSLYKARDDCLARKFQRASQKSILMERLLKKTETHDLMEHGVALDITAASNDERDAHNRWFKRTMVQALVAWFALELTVAAPIHAMLGLLGTAIGAVVWFFSN